VPAARSAEGTDAVATELAALRAELAALRADMQR